MLVASLSPFPLPLPQKENEKQNLSQKAQLTFPIYYGPYYPEVIHISIPTSYILRIKTYIPNTSP